MIQMHCSSQVAIPKARFKSPILASKLYFFAETTLLHKSLKLILKIASCSVELQQ